MSRRARHLHGQARRRGEACVLRVVTVTTDGPESSESLADHQTRGIFGDFDAGLVDGDRIRATDVRMMLPSLGLSAEPKAGDRVVRGGSLFEVLRVLPAVLAGNTNGYVLQLRGE
jgi:hypothetical protein